MSFVLKRMNPITSHASKRSLCGRYIIIYNSVMEASVDMVLVYRMARWLGLFRSGGGLCYTASQQVKQAKNTHIYWVSPCLGEPVPSLGVNWDRHGRWTEHKFDWLMLGLLGSVDRGKRSGNWKRKKKYKKTKEKKYCNNESAMNWSGCGYEKKMVCSGVDCVTGSVEYSAY